MSADQPQQGNNFLWCLRRYLWIPLACALAGCGTALLVAPSAPTYQADALVIARHLTVNSQVLPALAASVFADGAVTAKVATDPAVGGSLIGTIPDRVSVVPAQNSITLDVQGRHTDPATAARLANLAAGAFVTELNRGGAGVGEFALQTPAIVPTTPLSEFSQQLRAALGGTAGLILGLGLIALISVIRRPVVTAADVESATGVPLLGTVELRRPRGGYLGPRGVRGIAAVTRGLAAVPPGRLALISPRSAAGARRRIYVMLGIALSHVRPLSFEAPDQLLEIIRRDTPGRPHPHTDPRGQDAGDGLVLADAGSALDIVDPAMTSASIAAVAPRGLPRRRLRALAADYVDGGLVGIILVQGRGGFGRANRPSRPTASSPDVETADRVSDVKEPERA